MRIYADTSFLVSLLCGTDKAHATSRAFFLSQHEAEWITSGWSQFETVNTLRQLCLATGGLPVRRSKPFAASSNTGTNGDPFSSPT